jgi:hypothetical protein
MTHEDALEIIRLLKSIDGAIALLVVGKFLRWLFS